MNSTAQSVQLSPTQAGVLNCLLSWQKQNPILHLNAVSGMGKTEVLKQFQAQTGGHWLDVSAFIHSATSRHPLALQDAFWQLLDHAIKEHPLVIIDDFNYFFDYATGCNQNPRGTYHEAVAKALLDSVIRRGGQLVISTNGEVPYAFSDAQWAVSIGDFERADYQHVFGQLLGNEIVSQLDFDSIYRFAPNLSVSRLLRICHWLRACSQITTAETLEFIQNQGMASNVQVSEVQDVELSDLCGVDEVVRSLEDNIILPMENLKLADQLGLTPKRGVMLAGPPGTGKTTVGRALARRLRGKFFLIDGTIISGTDRFYYHVDHIFDMAIANAPSIVFIDDSDVIFESGREHGLYRYLLTMLDGLESKSANKVCVMMTAMDLGNIPPALVRSGRIELWLQMKLPDSTSRQRLLEKLMAGKVQLQSPGSWPAILKMTEEFSGADLKRLVQDAKLLMAADMSRDREVLAFEEYLRRATESIQRAQAEYARSAKRAMDVNVNRPRWFNVHPELFEHQGTE